MSANINEVRERLTEMANDYLPPATGWNRARDDLRALLADHARLAEELRKVNSGETVSVRFDLSPAAKEGAVRDQLVAMGWTPPGVAPAIDLEQFRDLVTDDAVRRLVRAMENTPGDELIEPNTRLCRRLLAAALQPTNGEGVAHD